MAPKGPPVAERRLLLLAQLLVSIRTAGHWPSCGPVRHLVAAAMLHAGSVLQDPARGGTAA